MRFVTDAEVAADGRMVLPQSVRDALGLTGETRLVVTVDGDEVRFVWAHGVVVPCPAFDRDLRRRECAANVFVRKLSAQAGAGTIDAGVAPRALIQARTDLPTKSGPHEI